MSAVRADDKSKNKKTRRGSKRRPVAQLHISSLVTKDDLVKLAKHGAVIEASCSGLLLSIERDDLVPMSLRKDLNIDELIGQPVVLHLEEMNLEVSGVVSRTKYVGKKGFHVAIDYTSDSPEYWRECLVDLLPSEADFFEN